MITSTKVIVLSYIKYRETSIIVRCYSEKFGYQSLVVNGIRSKKAKNSIGLFQPFTLLDCTIYYKDDKDIQRLSDARIHQPTPSLQLDFSKSTIVIFLTEMLSKLLARDSDQNNELFDYIWHSAIHLDSIESGHEAFHIHFLIHLSHYFGFGIQSAEDFLHAHSANDPLSLYAAQFTEFQSYNPSSLQTNGEGRTKITEQLIQYYKHHFEHLGEIKSIKILQQVFR
ncbi:MAG: DNA repair protein RecO [Cyclobacteriaceae bacterium]